MDEAQVEGAAQRGQALCARRPPSNAVIAEYDLHGATHVGVAAELGKVRHHHIRGQWHIALACHGSRMPSGPGPGPRQYLKHAAQLLHDLVGWFPRVQLPFRVDAQRCAGESLGQRQDARRPCSGAAACRP